MNWRVTSNGALHTNMITIALLKVAYCYVPPAQTHSDSFSAPRVKSKPACNEDDGERMAHCSHGAAGHDEKAKATF